MAVAVLADTKQLARLVVPKALLLQTAQTLQSRIGGLVGREIRHVPFSRMTPTTREMLELHGEHHREVRESSGVLIALPEHILSYQLSGLQRLADSKPKVARKMIGFQDWLTSNCRDVLDESDFTLAVKTQLIYPSGALVPLDGHPDRWMVVQTLLSLIEDSLNELSMRFPGGIEVTWRSQGFPLVHILQTIAEDALERMIVDAICDGRTPILPLRSLLPAADRKLVKKILVEANPGRDVFETVSRLFSHKPAVFKIILHIRGLVANGILVMCLKKRWNVQYGLHARRDPIAVPFEAKGVPAESAEFGYPDVAISTSGQSNKRGRYFKQDKAPARGS